jgi:hypothetical protein
VTQDNLAEIHKLFTSITGVTDRLDDKISGLLHNHELHFLNAYRAHMCNLKDLLTQKDEQIEKQANAINYYENEDVHSLLVKRVKNLEAELNKLYRLSDC